MKQRLLGVLVFVLYRILSWTWKVKRIEPDSFQALHKNKEPFILAHWHRDELVLLHLIGYYRVATIASTSKDGEIMNTVINLFGAITSRGSSTRGGSAALRTLLRLIKEQKRNSSFAVDGPKGPIYKVKPGVFEVSRLLKCRIYSAGISCDRAWHFPKSWNQTFLPKPFANVMILWTEALDPVSSDEDPRSPKLSETLENALRNAQVQAEKNLVAKLGEC